MKSIPAVSDCLVVSVFSAAFHAEPLSIASDGTIADVLIALVLQIETLAEYAVPIHEQRACVDAAAAFREQARESHRDAQLPSPRLLRAGDLT